MPKAMAKNRDLCKSRPLAGPIPDLSIPTLEGFPFQGLGRGGVGQIVDGSVLHDQIVNSVRQSNIY